MPPKVKVTKEDITRTALDLLRKEGESALNARRLAAALNCSTQPVFSNFSNMDGLRSAVIEAAYLRYFGFLKSEAESGKYPTYKAFGRAYIRFSYEEKELFKFLFMRDREGEGFVPTEDFEQSVAMIMNANGLPRERAVRMHLEMWACVHGIAAMMATSFFTPDWALIDEMLTDVYQGVRMRHVQAHQNSLE
jgi:AcrR family transcriptional regulator